MSKLGCHLRTEVKHHVLCHRLLSPSTGWGGAGREGPEKFRAWSLERTSYVPCYSLPSPSTSCSPGPRQPLGPSGDPDPPISSLTNPPALGAAQFSASELHAILEGACFPLQAGCRVCTQLSVIPQCSTVQPPPSPKSR